MHALIFIFLALTVLWLFYWAIVRQSILDSIEDDLARLKNHVAWQIINDAEGSRAQSAQCLVDEVEANRFVCWISFSQIALHLFQRRSLIKTEAAREAEIFKDCPEWIRTARDVNARLTIKAALANSPVWWLPLALILLGGLFSMSVMIWWQDASNSALQLRTGHFGIRQTA